VRLRSGARGIILAVSMSPPEFSVPARDLDAAGKPFRFPVRAAWIRGTVEGTDVSATDRDGTLEVRLSKSGNDVVLRGTLDAELVVPCARCLEPARVAIHETLSALFVPKSTLRAEQDRGKGRDRGDDDDVVGTADSPDVVAYDGEVVVLDGLVHDEMLLALPIVPLCSEACAGIRLEPSAAATLPDSPEELGVDPRLRPLLSLKHKT
jgi:uncharacterized protein